MLIKFLLIWIYLYTLKMEIVVKYLPRKDASSGIRKEMWWTEHSLVKLCIDLYEVPRWSHLVCFCSVHCRNWIFTGHSCGLWDTGTVIRIQLTQPFVNAIYYCVGILTWDLHWLFLERMGTNGTDIFWLVKLTLSNLELQFLNCNKIIKIIFHFLSQDL